MAKPTAKAIKAGAASLSQHPVSDVPGLGAVSQKHLERIGVTNLAALASASPTALKEACDNDLRTCRGWVEWARDALERSGFLEASTATASELLRRERAAPRISTGTPKLDAFFRGGLRGGNLYEVYAENGRGKSQLCLQMTVQALLKGEGRVIYLDTENAFKASRVAEMCEARGVEASRVMDSVNVIRSLNSAEQMLQIERLRSSAEADRVRLVICDSLTAHVRIEMPGRENMSDRSNWLMKASGLLKAFARIFNVPVLVTNQVTTDMDITFGDNKVAFGGTGLSHAVSYRIKITGAKKAARRKFLMEDSPEDGPIEEVVYMGAPGYMDDKGGEA